MEDKEETSLCTLEEVASRLGLNKETVRRMYLRGDISAIKIGHKILRFNYKKILQEIESKFTEEAL